MADVHSNIHALEPVLEQVDNLQLDDIVLCGDLVGYGAFPNEVVEFIQTINAKVVMGNHDEAVALGKSDSGALYHTKEEELGDRASLEWTQQEITEDNRQWLRRLPKLAWIGGNGQPRVAVVHGTPRALTEYLYQNQSDSDFRAAIEGVDADILVFGHTHIGYSKTVDGIQFVNCGSVGQPRDSDTRACYATIEIGKTRAGLAVEVLVRRVKYDVQSAARAVVRKGLPEELAQRLRAGC